MQWSFLVAIFVPQETLNVLIVNSKKFALITKIF